MRTPKKEPQAPAAKRTRRSELPAARRARSAARRPDADRALAEALEQQEATADILRTISHSPSDAQPVFEAIAKHASRLCGAEEGTVFRFDGELIHVAALADTSAPMAQALRLAYPRPASRDSVTTRAILTRAVVQIADVSKDTEFDLKTAARESGIRSALSVPMTHGEQIFGAITVARHRVEPFSPREIALLETFAEQALIAIENARLFNETKEALEHQHASTEILKVVSSSVSDSQPVFDRIVAICARLFPGYPLGINVASESGEVQLRACAGIDREALVKVFREVGARYAGGGLLLRGKGVQFPDVEAPNVPVPIREACRATGARAIAYAPMVADGRGIGSIWVARTTPGPFSEPEVALLQTFAEQAVIAIRNARLFNETREALERQTATADILRVIARTPTDSQPVFDAIVRSGLDLFAGTGFGIALAEGDRVRVVAAGGNFGPAATQVDMPRSRDSASGTAIVERRVVNIADTEAADAPPYARDNGRALGFRTIAVAPMLREGEAIGAIIVTLKAPGGLSDKELELLKTFSDQAVIAIGNARLFNETREALERQTATAEILKVISASPTDLQPVFDAILAACARLFQGHAIGINVRERDGRVGLKAYHGPNRAQFEAFMAGAPQRKDAGGLRLRRRMAHFPDVEHGSDVPAEIRTGSGISGSKAVIYAPMVSGGKGIGAIWVGREQVGEFSEREMALLETFADQAVIAIENVRLFKALEERNRDLAEALRQQTSTAEVLKTISRSTFDLNTVLQTLLDNATRLSGADRAVMYRPDAGGNFVPAVTFNYAPDSPILARLRARPIRPGRDSTAGRALLERRPIHIADVLADPEYGRQDLAETGSFRSVLAVPMLRDGEAIGLITFTKRAEAGAFTDKQMEVVTTFADQAVIAIENVRMFRELEDKGRQLEVANKHKSDFLANMSHELRTPLNAIIGFSEVLIERLFGEVNDKQHEYLNDIHESGRHLLSLINDILDLSKIEAGRMELDLAQVDVPAALANALTLVRERAQRHGLELALTVDPLVGPFRVDERKFKQILLNLLSNAVKFTPDGGRVELAARLDGGGLEVAVRDTGIGIEVEDQQAVFDEFRQVGRDYTKKAEGTGLGLALVKRLVELHGGEVRLVSAPGEGSTFTFTLPERL